LQGTKFYITEVNMLIFDTSVPQTFV